MKKTTWFLATLVAVCWLLPAQAQEEKNVATIVMITPKAGHSEQLIKGITEYHHWIAKHEGHHRYTWYEILTGPDTGKYLARSGNHSWADFDGSYDWEEEAGKLFGEKVAPHVEHMERYMSEEMTGMNHWPENWEGYTHFQVEHWYVKNGHWGPFRKGLKKIVDTLKAGGFQEYFGFSTNASGGHGGQVTLAMANQGWAGMADSSPTFYEIMSKELGGEEAFEAFMTDWSSTFKTGHNMMLRRMPEASDYGTD